MKKAVVMVMAGILVVAMMACGKDADTGNRSSSEQSSDEALEMLNAEINAMIEAEQREAEERAQRAERPAEEYPEGVLPEGDYWCYELREIHINDDRDSTLFYVPVVLEIYNDDVFLEYEYDAETKQYTILRRYYEYGNAVTYKNWHHQFIGYLDEEGNLIINHYERTGVRDYDDWNNVVLDDVEWVYVRENAEDISDNIEPTDVPEVDMQDSLVTLTQGVYECSDAVEYSLGTIDLINNKDYFYKLNQKPIPEENNLQLFYYPNNSNSWCFHIEGDLEANNLVINYFVRYDAEKLYEAVGIVEGLDKIRRFEEEYPDVADIILDDIEWVYVLQEE